MLKLSARQINQLPYIVIFKAAGTFLFGYSIYSMKESIKYGVYEIYPVGEAFEDVRIATKACTPIHTPGARIDILFEMNPKFKFFEKFKTFLFLSKCSLREPDEIKWIVHMCSFREWFDGYHFNNDRLPKFDDNIQPHVTNFLNKYFK